MSYKVSQIRKVYPGDEGVVAVDDVSIEISEGEFLVLLGPSGCGKSTVLRCLAGLESITSGRIEFGDRVVFDSDSGVDTPPDKRNVGMVFQNYALWPHMTVADNIGYPLKTQGRRRSRSAEIEAKVLDAARIVDCEALLQRFPSELSGGQQQRVALARGLVAQPDLVLFDEPLSNLDALLRIRVREQLHALHNDLGFTAIYVTHDQSEALALADRIAIMRDGRVDSLGTPQAIYERPPTSYAAGFLGMSNVITLQQVDGTWRAEDGAPVEVGQGPAGIIGGQTTFRFRPDKATVFPGEVAADAHAGSVVLPGEVSDRIYTGSSYDVVVRRGETLLRASVDARRINGLDIGTRCALVVPAEDGCWYGPDGHQLPTRDELGSVAL